MKKKKKYLAGFTTKLVRHILQTGTKREVTGTNKKKEGLFFLLCLNKKKTVYALIFLSPP